MNKFKEAYERILNENPQTRFKRVMHGDLPNVKSFAIITPENPMGKPLSKKENQKKIDEMKMYLKRGYFQYIRVNGQYGATEYPFVIFNINIKEAKYLGRNFDQESFIYAYNKKKKKKNKNVVFEYWEKEAKQKQYKKKDNVDYFAYEDDAKDFFTKLKSWKFNIPFAIFESILNQKLYNKHKLNSEQINYINEITDKIVNEDKTGKHKYMQRRRIRACINTGQRFDTYECE